MLRIEEVKENNFQEIQNPCRFCLYWQKTGAFDGKMLNPVMEKKNKNGSTKWLGLFEAA